MAVSYTHLDVYKRQPMYFLYRSSRENFMSSKTISVLPRSFFTLSFIMTPEVSSAVPVSYTHLDVYKRQVYDFTLAVV